MKKLFVILGISMSLTLAGCGSGKTSYNNNNKVAASEQGSGQAGYYFSQDQGQPDKQLINVINSSKSNLDIAIYDITKKDIVNAIVDAKKRGVNVRLITDKIESRSKSESMELRFLKKAGIPIKVNSHTGLMHLKVTIADKGTVTTGSFNYTQSATSKNDEVLVVIHDTNAVQQFEKEFQRMWNDTSNFVNY